MLKDSNVKVMLPVKDLETAKAFYEQKLGLAKVGEEMGTAVYRSGDSMLVVYPSKFAGTNQGTAALWEVEDVEATVADLKSRDVTFEHYDDLPLLTRTGDIHRGSGVEVAWFKDPDGNILSVQNRPENG